MSNEPGVNTISFSTLGMPRSHNNSYTPLTSRLNITFISIVIIIGIVIGNGIGIAYAICYLRSYISMMNYIHTCIAI
ncbi:hypothetical protein NMY3_02868 [Candidatus Nitrosocosmicus oleophilus]|uniref:Uncharacterized protein n=1 Tax=Candidatus Nitrosocosmicus oleophilus TaxID=1353260 RepID=A0A654M1K3_9ARCH|nr:hypothetical protein NMY3_02868 [Candidatus Nitrosocosmicus oleophilus]